VCVCVCVCVFILHTYIPLYACVNTNTKMHTYATNYVVSTPKFRACLQDVDERPGVTGSVAVSVAVCCAVCVAVCVAGCVALCVALCVAVCVAACDATLDLSSTSCK